MTSPRHHIDIIQGNDLTPAQEQFINRWNQRYFGEVAVAKGLAKAPVHRRLLLREDEGLLEPRRADGDDAATGWSVGEMRCCRGAFHSA